MSKSWDDMRKAKEEDYFARKEREALERLKQRQSEEKPRLSPISGKPMKQEVILGVTIDRCEESGGIWLDAGELEEILELSKHQEPEEGKSALGSFFKQLTGGASGGDFA